MNFRRVALFLFIAASPALAECPGKDMSADPSIKPDWNLFSDDLVNGEGLLWRIEKQGLQPSFLFGTIYSADPQAIAVAAQTAPYVKAASVVATELDYLDAKAKSDALTLLWQDARVPDRDVFDGWIDGEDVARVESLLARRAVARDVIHHRALWILQSYVQTQPCELGLIKKGHPTVSVHVVNMAQANQVSVVGLLTWREYFKAYESIPAADAASELKMIARDESYLDDSFATYFSLYEQKRPASARAFLESPPLRASQAELRADYNIVKLVVFAFNDALADRATPLLEKGGVFVAVAAAHLWGRAGLVERFRAMGYSVSKVW